MLKRLFVAVVFAGAVATAGNAADLFLKAPPRVNAPAFDWSGWFIGGHAGWLQSHETRNTTSPLNEAISQTGSGWLGGGQIGFDYQATPAFLIGLEASFSKVGLSATKRSIVAPASYYVTDLDWVASATGRAGFVSGLWLIYGRGGYAATNVTFTGLETAAGDIVHAGGTRQGWVAGGGIEYLIGQNFSVGVEYNHFDFSSRHYVSRTQVFGLPLNADVALDLDRVVLRASYRFGR